MGSMCWSNLAECLMPSLTDKYDDNSYSFHQPHQVLPNLPLHPFVRSPEHLCPCGETQTMSHIVESCPLTKLNGGLSRRHSANEDAVSWLTSYGSWHAYEKKKKKHPLFPHSFAPSSNLPFPQILPTIVVTGEARWWRQPRHSYRVW